MKLGRPFRVDLSRYAGKEVELLFSTDPGPKGSNDTDWAGWVRLAFTPLKENDAGGELAQGDLQQGGLHLRSAESSATGLSVQERRSSAGQRRVAPAQRPKLQSGEHSSLVSREFVRRRIGRADATHRSFERFKRGKPVIPGYHSQRVRIEAETSAPAVLMLNDANYPGWLASVNGKPAPHPHGRLSLPRRIVAAWQEHRQVRL